MSTSIRSQTVQRVLVAIAVAGATVASAACAGPAPASNQAAGVSTSADEPRTGGTLVFLESQVPTCLYAGGGGFYPNATLINQLGAKLTYQDPQTREIYPWLATKWQVNDDATEYTFTLRDDVTFADGTKLDAATVGLNFDHFGLGDESLGLNKQEFVSNYVASEVIDEHTVKFTFSAPSPGFLQATSVVGATIVSGEVAKLPYEQQCQVDNYIAAGPFVLDSYTTDSEWNLKARADYDWAPEPLHQGRAYLDAIQIVVQPESNVRVGALQADQADAIRAVEVTDIAGLEGAGDTVHYAPTNGVNPSFALRPTNPILADEKVRLALQRATDVDAIIQSIYLGKFNKATSVLSQGATGYVDLSDKLGYDPDAAKALLAEAGWKAGPDGILVKDGVKLELTSWPGAVFPLSQQLLELVAEQWEAVGVKLNVETPDPSTQAEKQRDPLVLPFNITHVGRVDPDVIWSNFGSDSNRNALVLSPDTDPELDKILSAIRVLPDNDARYAKTAEAQNYLIDHGYAVPLYELPQTYATAPNVHGLTWEAVGRVVLTETWLDQD